MPGGFGQRRVFIGVHTCPVGGRRKGCVCGAVVRKTKVGPPALSLLCPRSAQLVLGSPERLLSRLSPQTPHPGTAGNGVLLLLLRAAVERSWEELPAHPSHTDMAFMESLKQQILPGTCVVVGVKDGQNSLNPCNVPASFWHPQDPFPEKWTPESPWPHCNVPICQPGLCLRWTGVGAVMFECPPGQAQLPQPGSLVPEISGAAVCFYRQGGGIWSAAPCCAPQYQTDAGYWAESREELWLNHS